MVDQYIFFIYCRGKCAHAKCTALALFATHPMGIYYGRSVKLQQTTQNAGLIYNIFANRCSAVCVCVRFFFTCTVFVHFAHFVHACKKSASVCSAAPAYRERRRTNAKRGSPVIRESRVDLYLLWKRHILPSST